MDEENIPEIVEAEIASVESGCDVNSGSDVLLNSDEWEDPHYPESVVQDIGIIFLTGTKQNLEQLFNRLVDEARKEHAPVYTNLIISTIIEKFLLQTSALVRVEFLEVIFNRLEQFIPLMGYNILCLLNMFERIFLEKSGEILKVAAESLKNIFNHGLFSDQQISTQVVPLFVRLMDRDRNLLLSIVMQLILTAHSNVKDPHTAYTLINLFRRLIFHQNEIIKQVSVHSLFIWIQERETPALPSIVRDIGPFLKELMQDHLVQKVTFDLMMYLAKKSYLLRTTYQIPEIFVNCNNAWSEISEYIVENICEIVQTTENYELVLNLHRESFLSDPSFERIQIVCTNLLEFCRTDPPVNIEFVKSFVLTFLDKIEELLSGNVAFQAKMARNLLCFCAISDHNFFIGKIYPLIHQALSNTEQFRRSMIVAFQEVTAKIARWNEAVGKNFAYVIGGLIGAARGRRLKRQLILPIFYIINVCSSDVFNDAIRLYYVKLLIDDENDTRRAATVLFPLIVRRFGSMYSKEKLFPLIARVLREKSYLKQITAVFLILELMFPTVYLSAIDNKKQNMFLDQIKALTLKPTSYNFPRKLTKLEILNNQLQIKLNQSNVRLEHSLEFREQASIVGEETMECLKGKFQDMETFMDSGYLKALLLLINQSSNKIVDKILTNHPDMLVDNKARSLLGNIREFSDLLKAELQQSWVQNYIVQVPYNIRGTHIRDEMEKLLEAIIVKIN